MKNKTVTVYVSFPKKFYREVETAAKGIGWSVQAYCRWVLRKDLEKRGLLK